LFKGLLPVAQGVILGVAGALFSGKLLEGLVEGAAQSFPADGPRSDIVSSWSKIAAQPEAELFSVSRDMFTYRRHRNA
jgi:hypothetical protein